MANDPLNIYIDTERRTFQQEGGLVLGVTTEVTFTGNYGANPALMIFMQDPDTREYLPIAVTERIGGKAYLKLNGRAAKEAFEGHERIGEKLPFVGFVIDGDGVSVHAENGTSAVSAADPAQALATGVVFITYSPVVVDEAQVFVGNPRGMSAYELAVKYGFRGTEEQWVNSFAEGERDREYQFAVNEKNREETFSRSQDSRTSDFLNAEAHREAITNNLVSSVERAIGSIPMSLPSWSVINKAVEQVGNAGRLIEENCYVDKTVNEAFNDHGGTFIEGSNLPSNLCWMSLCPVPRSAKISAVEFTRSLDGATATIYVMRTSDTKYKVVSKTVVSASVKKAQTSIDVIAGDFIMIKTSASVVVYSNASTYGAKYLSSDCNVGDEVSPVVYSGGAKLALGIVYTLTYSAKVPIASVVEEVKESADTALSNSNDNKRRIDTVEPDVEDIGNRLVGESTESYGRVAVGSKLLTPNYWWIQVNPVAHGGRVTVVEFSSEPPEGSNFGIGVFRVSGVSSTPSVTLVRKSWVSAARKVTAVDVPIAEGEFVAIFANFGIRYDIGTYDIFKSNISYDAIDVGTVVSIKHNEKLNFCFKYTVTFEDRLDVGKEVTEIKKKIEQYDSFDARIESCENEVKEATEAVGTIPTFRDRNVVIIGDSIVWYGGRDCDEATKPVSSVYGWTEYFKSIAKPLSCHGYGQSGAPWCHRFTNPSRTGGIHGMICTMIDEYDAGRQPLPDVIIISGGENDINNYINDEAAGRESKYDLDTTGEQVFVNCPDSYLVNGSPLKEDMSLAESIRYDVEIIKRKFPIAQVFLLSPIQSKHNFSYFRKAGDRIEDVAGYLGCPCIRMDKEVGFYHVEELGAGNSINTYDGVHPSQRGAKTMGYYVANRIRQFLRVSKD